MQVVALLAIALLIIPISVSGIPSPSKQLAGSQINDWASRTIPYGHYVNFTEISTPYGLGYHVDSIGNSLYAYHFMGCTNKTFIVAPDGTLTVWGWFRQSDTFDASLQPGRRTVLIYISYADSPGAIAKVVVALTCDDGTDWRFRNITAYGLCPGKFAQIGIGRGDYWETEWNQAAEWAGVHVSEDPVGSSWSATSSPSGHTFSFYTFATPFGLGYHIDSSGPTDFSYDFYGYTNEVFTVGRSGEVRVRGWFKQYDSYYGTYLKEVNVFAVSASNPSVYQKGVTVLDYTDGNDWEYKDVVIGGLAPGSQVRIGVGRHDGWAADWMLTAEWACIEILPENFENPAPGLKWNINLGQQSNSSILVADLDLDGRTEALVGTFDGSVYCVDCLTGTLDWSYHTYTFDAKPALGDIDGDGKLEVVIATGLGELRCLNDDGTARWVRSVNDIVFTSPTLADLDGDGRAEILVGSASGNITCFDGTGAREWSTQIGGQILFSSPCCADFDNDNETEIAVGSVDDALYFLNRLGGLEWSYPTSGGIFYPTVAADIDNDGKPEVVATTFNGWIYCVNGSGGTVWSYKAGLEITSRPVVGDIDADGVQEMLVMVGPGFCNLTCLTYAGGIRWTCPIGGPANNVPIIAQSKTGFPADILLNCGGTLNCLSSCGVMQWGLQAAQYICGAPLAADTDQDNVLEILVMGDTTLRHFDYGLPIPTRLWVIVTNDQGVALPGASILCTGAPSGQPSFSSSTTWDGDGHVSFISLVSGYYSFQFSCPGYGSKSISTYLGYSTWEKLSVMLSVSWGGGGSDGGVLGVPLVFFSSILVVLLILGTIGLVARRSDRWGTGSGSVHVGNRPNTAMPDIALPKEEPVSSARAPRICPSCGAAITYRAAEYCRTCGARLPAASQTARPRSRRGISGYCTICGLRIQDGSDTLKCPRCGGVAHRIHMLEWLHVKDYCPICQKHLEERDFDGQ
jgi:predicted RNA-binding Zn-ribbon protein involved in translation (DUF1610 family)